MRGKQPTHSVRKCGAAETWLDRDDKWGPFESRKRFPTPDAAETRVLKVFGPDFQGYGIFPNSPETAPQ